MNKRVGMKVSGVVAGRLPEVPPSPGYEFGVAPPALTPAPAPVAGVAPVAAVAAVAVEPPAAVVAPDEAPPPSPPPVPQGPSAAAGTPGKSVPVDVFSEIRPSDPGGTVSGLPATLAAAMNFDWAGVPPGVEVYVPVALLDDSPHQPEADNRHRYNSIRLDALGNSLSSGGQSDAVKVIWDAQRRRFVLSAGHRRKRAMRAMDWLWARAIILTDAQLKDVVASNTNREDEPDYKVAQLARRMIDTGELKSITEAAHVFGKERSEMSRALNMLNLPRPILDILDANPALIGTNTARDIASLLKQYPQHEALIVQAVERVADGSPQSSIKGWVAQKVRALEVVESSRTKVITDRGGKPMLEVTAQGRSIQLKLKSDRLDIDGIMERVYAAIQSERDNILCVDNDVVEPPK